ncbi:MAG TPA: 4'-phosphopantetheinyl transferase superfamily protein [Thermoanaerobaculia bacterium]|nr:4'-phosphopantetheinyl transferase superfamily protein [Thermoanaerobaculia bacterium]
MTHDPPSAHPRAVHPPPAAPGLDAAGWRPGEAWSPPAPGTVDLWRVDLDAPQGEPELLDPAERARADRFLVEAPRRQFARGRAALRRVLGPALGVEPGAVRFEVGPHGRPSLARDAHGAAVAAGVDFNLSHSGMMTLIGVAFAGTGAAVQLGVDVEEERANRPLDRLAERFFAPPEAAQYRVLPAPERVAAFYRGWTRKEAYLKAWGTGLTFSSRRFVVDLAATAAGELGGDVLRSTEMAGDDSSGWRFVDLRLAPGYPGALCVRGPLLEVRRFSLEPGGRVLPAVEPQRGKEGQE